MLIFLKIASFGSCAGISNFDSIPLSSFNNRKSNPEYSDRVGFIGQKVKTYCQKLYS
jgi:hypothetical protein